MKCKYLDEDCEKTVQNDRQCSNCLMVMQLDMMKELIAKLEPKRINKNKIEVTG